MSDIISSSTFTPNDMLLVLRLGRKRIKQQLEKKKKNWTEKCPRVLPLRHDVGVHSARLSPCNLNRSRHFTFSFSFSLPYFYFLAFSVSVFFAAFTPSKCKSDSVNSGTRCGGLIRPHAPRFDPFHSDFHATPLDYNTHDLTLKND
jgi:hypothetical protein